MAVSGATRDRIRLTGRPRTIDLREKDRLGKHGTGCRFGRIPGLGFQNLGIQKSRTCQSGLGERRGRPCPDVAHSIHIWCAPCGYSATLASG
jgi:hypothetical protein